MRMGFGLAGLLITIGVIAWFLHTSILPYNKTVIEEGKKAETQVRQMAGVGADGMRTMDSITLEDQSSNGRTNSILVTAIVAGGPMETYFGLKRSDSITAVNDQKVRDMNDPELAKSLVFEAFQRQWTLTVIRDGQQLTLPPPKPAGTPANSGASGPSGDSSIQHQLDAIQKIPTH